jgi:hypothetical protein
MSAPGPESEPERERRRHRGPLVGMALVVVFGVGLILYWILESAATTEAPADPGSVEVPPRSTLGEDDANRPDVPVIDASPP